MKRMTRIISLLLTVVMVLGLFPAAALADQGNLPFTDVTENDWFYDEVQYVYENGLMNGTDAATFAPGLSTTRGMIVTILWRMESMPEAAGEQFDDVDEDAFYADAVLWAAENGIVTGYGDGRFGPDAPVTREQLATILYHYAQYCKMDVSVGEDTNILSYNDAFEVSEYAFPALQWACGAGLIQGADGNLMPQGNATRAQVAAILSRFLEEETAKPEKQPEEELPEELPEETPEQPDTGESYTVLFHLGISALVEDTAAYQAQTVKAGERVQKPADPTPKFGRFDGWYTSEDGVQAFDFNQPVQADTTIYAKWVFDQTDSDGDGLSDEAENYLGMDPADADEDDDGLNDYVEKLVGTDPAKPDTDGNGVDDSREDADQDGLTNGEEVAAGTSPVREDSDFDGLTDLEEMQQYGTDPMKEDTDGDGADDGWEVANGYDPLKANASFVVTDATAEVSADNPVAAAVEAEVDGGQVETLEVKRVGYSDSVLISPTIPGYLGCAYDFSVEGSIRRAKLIFKYDTALGTISDTFQPRIYYFNEEEGTLEELKNQTVENGCVTVEVSHFSTYILLNKVEFDKVWEEEIRLPSDSQSNITGLDVVFVIDSSGSMSSNDRKGIRLEAAKQFVAKLGENDRAAVVDFDSDAILYQSFTSDHALLNKAIERVDASGGTNLSNGISLAIQQFTDETYTRTDAYKYIIFLTDGNGRYSSTYTTQAAKEGIIIFTIGLGSGVKESVLKQIAEGTGGKYYFASLAAELPDIYEDVSFETVDYTTDTNNDGISDYYTKLIQEGKLTYSNHSTEMKGVDLNYNKDGELSDDYDGDGLRNGEEIQVVVNGNQVYLKMYSHPMLVHSDGDGMDDQKEACFGTDPLRNDIEKKAVDIFMNDDYYACAGFADSYEGDWLWKLDTEVLGVLFGVWNKDELYRDILTDYFYKYADQDCEGEMSFAALSVAVVDMLSGGLDQIQKYVSNNASYMADIYELISKANGAKNMDDLYLVIETFETIWVEVLDIYDDSSIQFYGYKISSKATKHINLSKIGKTAGKVLDGLSYVAYGMDVVDTITSFAKVNANNMAFEKNAFILNEIYEKSNDDHAKDAAYDILATLAGNYGEEVKACVADGVEIAIDVAIDAIAKANPYVLAVVLVRDGFEIITGISSDIKQQFQMLCYDETIIATRKLLKKNIDAVGDYYEFDVGKTSEVEQCIVHLFQLRVLGEMKWCEWQQFEGLLGFIDNSSQEEMVKNTIDALVSWMEYEYDETLEKQIKKFPN